MYPDLFMNFPKKFEEKILKLFKCKRHYTTDELHRQAIELAGLKRFLLDYTLIAERTAIEVNLFENYLIYAQMMGIAKKVAKQFKELYPDEMEVYYETDSFICYRVQQNVNSPYNFAIDYGYNNPTPKAGSEEE